MRVIDSQRASWFLFQDGEDLLLDVNCNMSAAGYSVVIRLTPAEMAEYRTAGRQALSALAGRVQDTGPHGEYQKRHLRSVPQEALTDAVRAWRVFHPDTA